MLNLISCITTWKIYLHVRFPLQHYLTMFGGTIGVPLILAAPMCYEDNNNAKAKLICTILFMSGLVTFLQSTFGSRLVAAGLACWNNRPKLHSQNLLCVRLPIVQGGSFAFLGPALAILNLPQWKCPTNLAGSVLYMINTMISIIIVILHHPPLRYPGVDRSLHLDDTTFVQSCFIIKPNFSKQPLLWTNLVK